MAQDLREYLKGRKSKGFSPVPHYFARGDFLSYFFRNDRCFAQRVDELLTVYLSIDTQELIGCKIKGVKHFLETAGNFGVAIKDGRIQLGFLFFAGAMMAKEPEQKQRYDQLAPYVRDATIDRALLQSACQQE